MKSLFKNMLCAAGLISLAACAQPELPQDSFYRLQLNAPQSGGLVLNGVLEVERFRADGLTSGRPLVYSEGAGKLAEYHYHFWVEAPVDLLQDEMVSYLRASNVATHVVTPDLRMDEDYLLTGKIKRLERLLSGDDKVAVELELGLKEVKTDRILVLKTYTIETNQTDAGMHGAVQAMNTALSDIYSNFLADVRASQ